ncbi:MAG: flagellar basal body P-ring formation protein FlgA [Proteobacteria bacterium]|nr:flagellar basal body P-ring formation protein FlgA [Burkholderiales bacterium]
MLTGIAPAQPSQARTPPIPSRAASNEAIVQQVTAYIQEQTRSLPGAVQVTVNALEERTRLAPCDDLQLFMPSGARLWGPTSVGVRCTKPQAWQIFVPATVRVSGPVVIANRALAPGAVIEPNDVGVRTEDLTALPASVLLDPAQAIGRTLASGIPAGAALRAENVKLQWAVVQGQTVRVVYESDGLRVTADGKALGNAAVGQGVEVRVGSGKTVRGTARSSGVVVVK